MYSKTYRAKVLLSGGLVSIFCKVRHFVSNLLWQELMFLYFILSSLLKVHGLLQGFQYSSTLSAVVFPGDQKVYFSKKKNKKLAFVHLWAL
jgi:hypothetical protein